MCCSSRPDQRTRGNGHLRKVGSVPALWPGISSAPASGSCSESLYHAPEHEHVVVLSLPEFLEEDPEAGRRTWMMLKVVLG